MNIEAMLKNKTLSDEIVALAAPFYDEKDEFIIAVEADLLPNGNYGRSPILYRSDLQSPQELHGAHPERRNDYHISRRKSDLHGTDHHRHRKWNRR